MSGSGRIATSFSDAMAHLMSPSTNKEAMTSVGSASPFITELATALLVPT